MVKIGKGKVLRSQLSECLAEGTTDSESDRRNSKRSDTFGSRRTNRWIRDQQHGRMLQQKHQKG